MDIMTTGKTSARRAGIFRSEAAHSIAGVLLGAALAFGCSTVQLVPVNPALGSEAMAAAPGVEVRANADESQRPWTVPRAFTPVRLSVRNTGSEPVFIELDDIRLAGAERSLTAVSPGSIQPRRRVASLGLDPGSPFVAPQAGGGSPYGRTETLVLGPAMSWAPPPRTPGHEAAQAEIVGSAFSEGAIESGETRTGLVYFRHVPADAGQLTLSIGVRPSAEKNAPRRVVEILYAVQT